MRNTPWPETDAILGQDDNSPPTLRRTELAAVEEPRCIASTQRARKGRLPWGVRVESECHDCAENTRSVATSGSRQKYRYQILAMAS